MRRTSGLSLLILIFVSLCLITFSLLSVSESRADQALGEKMAARTTTYYEANTKANQLLSKIDAQLANYLRLFSSDASSTPESSYYDSCRQIADVIPEVSWDTDTHTVSFAIATPKASSSPSCSPSIFRKRIRIHCTYHHLENRKYAGLGS